MHKNDNKRLLGDGPKFKDVREVVKHGKNKATKLNEYDIILNNGEVTPVAAHHTKVNLLVQYLNEQGPPTTIPAEVAPRENQPVEVATRESSPSEFAPRINSTSEFLGHTKSDYDNVDKPPASVPNIPKTPFAALKLQDEDMVLVLVSLSSIGKVKSQGYSFVIEADLVDGKDTTCGKHRKPDGLDDSVICINDLYLMQIHKERRKAIEDMQRTSTVIPGNEATEGYSPQNVYKRV